MARTVKNGLEYFPFDVDFFQDLRIRKLIKYQGGKAITVYALLLCLIYKSGYYIKWDDELPFIISEQTGYDEAYIQEVINCCLSIGLFSKELFKSERVMTSNGIQKRYMNINRISKRTASITEYNLIERRNEVETDTNKKSVQPEPSELSPCEPYMNTLDQEIEILKNDECWLDQLQLLHHMEKSMLRKNLDSFRVQCKSDGKERHASLQDAKQHFNSWLRIVNNNKSRNDDKNKSNGRNQRRANILGLDEKKTYGESF
jgi:hypothetical protein